MTQIFVYWRVGPLLQALETLKKPVLCWFFQSFLFSWRLEAMIWPPWSLTASGFMLLVVVGLSLYCEQRGGYRPPWFLQSMVLCYWLEVTLVYTQLGWGLRMSPVMSLGQWLYAVDLESSPCDIATGLGTCMSPVMSWVNGTMPLTCSLPCDSTMGWETLYPPWCFQLTVLYRWFGAIPVGVGCVFFSFTLNLCDVYLWVRMVSSLFVHG